MSNGNSEAITIYTGHFGKRTPNVSPEMFAAILELQDRDWETYY